MGRMELKSKSNGNGKIQGSLHCGVRGCCTPSVERTCVCGKKFLEIEAVGADVACDRWRKQVGAGVAGAEALAQAGCGEIFVDGLEQVDAGALRGREMK